METKTSKTQINQQHIVIIIFRIIKSKNLVTKI